MSAIKDAQTQCLWIKDNFLKVQDTKKHIWSLSGLVFFSKVLYCYTWGRVGVYTRSLVQHKYLHRSKHSSHMVFDKHSL